ncbi:MAG: type I methionyl aminopeptidase [Candidatus Pacebacteria bacterium]|nr:type I methionyl aminopeptidase [Candidatus Paceibacterota bacterium]
MINIKTEKEIAIMKEGGKILANIMEKAKNMIAPGVAPLEIDRACEALILQYGCESAFKNYEGFPTVSCCSVNDMVVHGVPNSQLLKQGDLICFDLGIKYQGYYLDAAFAMLAGKPESKNSEAIRLIKTTQKALRLAIAKAQAGNTFGDIGNVVQRFVEYQGFNVVRDLCGHGIGKALHEDPKICNYGKRHTGQKIEIGMVFCIEPMVVMGDWKLKKANDGFGYKTADGSLACHFEHTIATTKKGAEVLTKI